MRTFSIFIFHIIYSMACSAQPSAQKNSRSFVVQDSSRLKNLIFDIDSRLITHVQEKVYLHLDRPSYLPGDTIWYKAYTVIGARHQLSALSGVLYVELIDPKDSVVSREILSLKSGTAAGDMQLSAMLPQGVYRLRAYTRWMENFAPAGFYDQQLYIGIPTEIIRAARQAQPDVHFFPEGGTLINGVRSRVAIKAVDTTGLGVDVSGTIQDNQGNIITDFATRHLGMGVFALTPETGKSYKAVIKISGETAFTVQLPPASETGATLGLNNSDPDSIYLKVATNSKTLTQQLHAAFYILGESGGQLFYTSAGKFDGLVYTAAVDKRRFPSGVTRFTLFSQDDKPIAERLAFIENNDTLKLSLGKELQMHTLGKPTKEGFKVTDGTNKPVAGNFSISVINEDEQLFDIRSEGNIFTGLLLTSEVKGSIEKPNYYFTNRNGATRTDLDILLLTQGYRTFNWDKISGDTSVKAAFQPEKALSIGGHAQTKKGKPVAKAHITLAAMREGFYLDTLTDENGRFRFTGINLPDSTKVMLRLAGEKVRENVRITLDTPRYPIVEIQQAFYNGGNEISGMNGQKTQKEHEDLVAMRMAQKAKQLKEVTIRAQKIKSPDVPYSDNLNGPGHANQVIKSDGFWHCATLSECLAGRIAGVLFDEKTGEAVSMRTQNRRSPLPMKLIVDGVMIDPSRIGDIDPNDVNTVEVLLSGSYLAIYGSNAFGGALVITLKKGRETNPATVQSDILTCVFNGFHKSRSFYVPKYNTDESNNSPTTVYWNPNINSDTNGNALFKYVDGDKKGNYRLVIEGIDDNGDLGRLVYRYKVE